uniref:Uncharacterized protein n=1 Tax=Arcella intermedia TaxID=1963864 RepID=A0A6B2LL03_9EUKA
MINNHFVDEYDPTIEDSYRKQMTIDGRICIIEFLDTCYEGEWSMQGLYFRQAEGFIIAFSITSRASFEVALELRERIRNERGTDNPSPPTVLCGTKCDLHHQREVTQEEAQQLAMDWNCPYLETSSLQRINIEETICEIVREIRKVSNEKYTKRGGGCAIL